MKIEGEEEQYPLGEGQRRDRWRGAARGECSELRGEVGMKRDAGKEMETIWGGGRDN